MIQFIRTQEELMNSTLQLFGVGKNHNAKY